MGVSGKLPGLVWLLRNHGEALEADFQQYYGIDLTGLWRNEVTPRRAMALARHLPFGCATWMEVGTDAAWSTETHMLAHVIDLLNGANWQRGGAKGAAPKPIDRPEDDKAAQAKRDRALARAAKFRALHGPPKSRAVPEPSTDRPRDSRGRFVSREGG